MKISKRAKIMSIPPLGALLLCPAILSLLVVPVCRAEEAESAPAFAFGMEADLNSRFIWRGIALSRGMVLQPAAYLTVHNFTFDVWNNFELKPETGERHYNETDLTISYSREWRKFNFEPALQTYLYPRNFNAPNTAEASLKIAYPLRSIDVFTRHVFDLAAFRGAYFGEAGIDWQKEFGRRLELSVSGSAGWGGGRFNDAYFGVPGGALNVVSLDMALSWQAAKNLRIRPHANLSALVSSHLRNAVSEPDLKSFGITMCLDF
jgi:hypothetical protein